MKKKLVKGAFALATTLLIGKLIKLERQLEEHSGEYIDRYFDAN
jgi:hypothetical protein